MGAGQGLLGLALPKVAGTRSVADQPLSVSEALSNETGSVEFSAT